MRGIIPLSLATVVACVGTVHARETIVGTWKYEGGQCVPADGLISIGPKQIVGDEHRCDFDTVSRKGDVVTWKGLCGWPEDFKRATVVARLVGKRLYVDYGGGENDAMVRCKPDW